ncbi:MAG: PrpF domain-containing protein [Alphaproteobacteria bacterium]
MPDAAGGGTGYGGLAPRIVNGVLEFPVYHMRGGTSTGIVLYEPHLPKDLALREELIRRLMGVPVEGERKGNKQITGLGRGIPTSCKVFLLKPSERPDADLDSTLAQLAPEKAAIDWSVNCGNMSAALPMYALETGMLARPAGRNVVRIFNTNTGVVTHAHLVAPEPGEPYTDLAEIPGVMGGWPAVQLALLNPSGSKTGKLLPTGNAVDVIDGVEVSCVDLAVPMVIMRAADFGKTAAETPAQLDSDAAFQERFRKIWIEAGLRMGLKKRDGSPMSEAEIAASETIPKACIVAPPSAEEAAKGANIRVRYFTPQAGHGSMAVTGGSCLAAGCLIPGSVPSGIVQGVSPLGPDEAEHVVLMANPAGILKSTVVGALRGGAFVIPSASYERSAQVLLRGATPVYGTSAALLAAYAP